ncbi:MAG: VWA domain-containing protein [Bacteroidota bacterium]|nr:VWA domain-containing protein [Bacteroidota bacterium]
MYQIEEISWLWLGIIPLLVMLLFIGDRIWKSNIQDNFLSKNALMRLSPNISSFKPYLRIFTILFCLIFLVLAMINPQMGTKMETFKRFGVDIVFAVDVSRSMLAEDIVPNRLEKSKQLVNQIINTLNGDRIGIVAYAGKAFPQLPITTDYSSGKMFLQSMNTDMISSQGTAIDEAIQLATNYYDDESKIERILIIISDGEDHNDVSVDMAKIASEKGIIIYTIGVGKEKGAPIPIKKNGIIQSYKKDNKGEVVITKLNRQVLVDIANQTGGEFIDGTETKFVVNRIGEILKETEKKEFESKKFSEYKDQFQWFLAIGLLLLFIEIFLFDPKTFWVKKLNLFNEN